MIGVTHGAISQLERGQINYTQPMLEAIAAALHCRVGDLVERDPNNTTMLLMSDQLAAATPEKQRQALEIVSAFLKAS
jgi:transcriptional regulator with XRE-family HTH domain